MMIKVTLRSWHTGLKTVTLIQLLRKHGSLDMACAKALVDRFVGGSEEIVWVSDEAAREEFLSALRAAGAEGE